MNDLLRDAPPPPPEQYRELGRQQEEDQDLEAAMASADGGTDSKLQRFFDDVNEIKNDMQQVKQKLGNLQETNEESKRVTRAKEMKALKERMEDDINDVLKLTRVIKGKIERLDRENVESRKWPGCEQGTSTDRTRMSITLTQKKKLKELMMGFQELRNKIADEYKEVVERRVYTVTGQKPEPELVDRLIETGNSESIFQKAIQEQGRTRVMDTIAEIQERHDAVKDIERQLLELHQIFMDMAVLVESQGELLDNIETQVEGAKEHTEQATKELVNARNTQINTRRWLFCGILALIIIIVVVVIVIIQPWKK